MREGKGERESERESERERERVRERERGRVSFKSEIISVGAKLKTKLK